MIGVSTEIRFSSRSRVIATAVMNLLTLAMCIRVPTVQSSEATPGLICADFQVRVWIGVPWCRSRIA